MGSSIWISCFLLYPGNLPTQDTWLCPTLGSAACEDPRFLQWLTEKPPPHCPEGCFQIWSPKRKLAQVLPACCQTTHFHSFLPSTPDSFFASASLSEDRRGESSCFNPCDRRTPFLHPFCSVSPPDSDLSLRVKGKRSVFQMQCLTINPGEMIANILFLLFYFLSVEIF